MKTLINDYSSYADLFEDKLNYVKINSTYIDAEYNKQMHIDNISKCLNNNAYVCDSSIADFCLSNNIEYNDILDLFKDVQVINNFGGFNIATYNYFNTDKMKIILEKTQAKIIDYSNSELESGYRLLKLNKSMAYKKAANIVLDAYDNGADFLLVADEYSYCMFDTFSQELMRESNRDFSDFYILNYSEFIALLLNKIPNTLKSHKLKVSLI